MTLAMEEEGYLYARDLDELSRALHLVERSTTCVLCDDSAKLDCACDEGYSCYYTIPTNCTVCAQSICRKDTSSNSGSKPNIGGIVGGVLGGLLVVGVATYLVWRFCIKPKRAEMSQTLYDQESIPAQGSEKDAASRGVRPQSTHTVHSIASTVLTRASNIIQIAYIPGVTNRATPTSPNVLVPPVPPIPVQHAAGQNGADEQHFFVPGDLRDSTYSGLSGYSDRTSYARTSYAPRSSVASTIYGKQAQMMAPAQTGMRAKPTMVSVKSGANSLEPNMPPVPAIDFERFGNSRPKSGASAFSVGSTFLNSANTATQARAQVVKVVGLKKIDIGAKSESDSSTLSVTSESRPTTPSRNATRDSSAITIIEDSPTVDQGPFSDPPAERTPAHKSSVPALGAVIEEAAGETDRNSQRGSSHRRDSSPFGDQHATKE